jgi:hypothetical protein
VRLCRSPSWSTTLFDAACRADILENLRTHAYRDPVQTRRSSWAVSWGLDVVDNNAQVTVRHDIVHVCQSVLEHVMQLPRFEQVAVRQPEVTLSALGMLVHAMQVPRVTEREQLAVCQLELIHFVVKVLDHSLDKENSIALDVRHIFRTLAYSRGDVLVGLVNLTQQRALTVDQCGESLVHVLFLHAPISALDEWLSRTDWIDQALHTDWCQPSLISQRNLTDELLSVNTPSNTQRLSRLVVLQERWNTYVRPAMIDTLLVYLPSDLVRHVLLPYLEPLVCHAQSRSSGIA